MVVRVRAIALAGALLLALPALAAGTPAAVGHAGHSRSAPRDALGASAVVDADGGLWAVSQASGHVLLRHRGARDTGWGAPVRVNAAPEEIAADGDARPKIALGTAGEIYVSWTRPLARPYTGEIRFTRSLDGGRHFETPWTLHSDRQEITHRFDALAVLPNGRVLVAWIDKRDQEAARRAGMPYRGAAVYYATAINRGGTFGPDVRLAEHSCECCRIALHPDRDGGLLVFWRHVFAPNVRDHAIARIGPDGAPGEMVRATFNDWAVDACPHHGPGLAVDADGRRHAVWFTLGEPSGVLYGRLRAGRVEGQRVLGDATAAHAEVAATGRRVAIVWKAFDGERVTLAAERSDDGGETWRAFPLAETAGAADQPRLLVRGDDFVVVWNTAQDGLRVLPVRSQTGSGR